MRFQNSVCREGAVLKLPIRQAASSRAVTDQAVALSHFRESGPRGRGLFARCTKPTHLTGSFWPT